MEDGQYGTNTPPTYLVSSLQGETPADECHAQVDGSIWFYAPNKAAPVFFAAAFAGSTLCHIWQCMYVVCLLSLFFRR